MNKKIFLLALIILLIIGCKNKLSDPLNGLLIGSSESSWRNQIDILVVNKKFIKTETQNSYAKFIFDSIPAMIQVNTDFNIGKLLNYKISFEGAPIEMAQNSRPYYMIFKSDYIRILKVFNNMIQIYGRPDSLIPGHNYSVFSKLISEDPLIDTLKCNFLAIWKKKKYDIFFNIGGLVLYEDSKNKIGYSGKLLDCSITYQHPNYNNEIKSIIDTAIAGYKIADYIESKVDNPEIREIGYNYSIPNREVKFSVIKFTRLENLDNRGIISVLADIVFYDNFENELGRFEDMEFEFRNNILVTHRRMQNRIPNESYELLKERMSRENNRVLIFNKTYTYSSRSPNLQKLEYAFLKESQIITKLHVKAIKFDDSSVLKL